MMRATEILFNEHRVIEQVLACLEKMAEQAEREQRLDDAPARDAVEFFRNHGKEEAQLFPLMERRGFSPDAGPTAVMRHEHVQGRDCIRRIDAAIGPASSGDADGLRDFARAAREYVTLLRAHIQKEDHCLFPMADTALDAADQQRLLDGFLQVDREQIGTSAHAALLRVADELADRFGVVRATAQPPAVS
jgi:hemerythrin-like domain-containing protein